MRLQTRTTTAALLLFTLSGGCAGDSVPANHDAALPDLAPPGDAADCNGTIAEFCQSAPCKSWNDSVADARQLAASGQCFFIQLGTCGSGHVLRIGHGFGGTVEYFDGAGRLYAAIISTDTNEYCGNTSFDRTFGTLTDCAEKITEELCVFGHTDLGVRDL